MPTSHSSWEGRDTCDTGMPVLIFQIPATTGHYTQDSVPFVLLLLNPYESGLVKTTSIPPLWRSVFCLFETKFVVL